VKKGFVYIVTHDSLKWRAAHPVVKIGCAVDIKKRIADLNTASPINLILVASIQSDNALKLESYLHKAFTRNRLNGEWFSLDQSMINALRKQYLVEDKFDELFDCMNRSLDAKDVEISSLKQQISELYAKRENDLTEIKALRDRLEESGVLVKSRQQTYDNRFQRDYKKLCRCQ
jgi:hypothetical protein